MSKQFSCDLCQLQVQDKYSLELHVAGKKHQSKLQRAELAHRQAECGIFVKGIPPNIPTNELQTLFKTFGSYDSYSYNCERHHLFVTYRDKQSAQNALRTPIYAFGRRLLIQPRRPVSVNNTPKLYDFSQATQSYHRSVKVLLSSPEPTLNALVEELELSPDRSQKHRLLCQDLEAVFRTRFPGCIAHLFGSTVTGLGLKCSDVDVFLDVCPPESHKVPLNAPVPKELVLIGRKLMYQNQQLFANIIAVSRARIPIIKFVHRSTKISCDVSFRNSFGLANSKLISFYVSLDPRIKPFLMIIKYWAKVHHLSGTGKMSNYALVLMSLFYLQQLQKPVIPPVTELQKSFGSDDLCEMWMCKFDDDPSHVKPTENKENVFELLTGFFEYYFKFNFGVNVVCPFLGLTLSKAELAKKDTLPESMKWYKCADKAMFDMNSNLCVQDPFLLDYNATKNISAKAVENFHLYCQLAKGICENISKESEKKQVSMLMKLFDAVIPKPPDSKVSRHFMELVIPVGQYLCIDTNMDEVTQSQDLNNLMIHKWYSTVTSTVVSILEKVMKFKMHEEKSVENISKVQKVGEPSDVHGKAADNHVKVLCCEGSCNVWDGRKKMQKQLHLPPTLHPLVMEEMISEAIIKSSYKNLPQEPILRFSVTFQVKTNPTQVLLSFRNIGTTDKIFMHVMYQLQLRIPVWVKKCLGYKQKQNADETKPYSDSPGATVQQQ